MTNRAERQRAPRIEAIDLARGVALVAMAIYHFTWDLEFFGYVDPGMTARGGWKLFARVHRLELPVPGRRQPVPRPWQEASAGRLPQPAGDGRGRRAGDLARHLSRHAASGFIFFGILHQIALASLLGLGFLRLPAAVTLACRRGR